MIREEIAPMRANLITRITWISKVYAMNNNIVGLISCVRESFSLGYVPKAKSIEYEKT